LLREAPHDIVEERSRRFIKKWSCWITGTDGIEYLRARPGRSHPIRREVFEISGDRSARRTPWS
jgi:hypothetical protein